MGAPATGGPGPLDLPMPTHEMGLVTPTCGLARAAVGFTTKQWLNLSARLRPTAWIVLGVLFAVLWVHQQGNAEFVMNARL